MSIILFSILFILGIVFLFSVFLMCSVTSMLTGSIIHGGVALAIFMFMITVLIIIGEMR